MQRTGGNVRRIASTKDTGICNTEFQLERRSLLVSSTGALHINFRNVLNIHRYTADWQATDQCHAPPSI
jgi:hypothetical protein